MLCQYRIATFMPKICTADNVQVRTSLACTSVSSVWTSWLPVLQTLHNRNAELAGLPAPSTSTFFEWLTIMVPAGSTWTRMAKDTFLGNGKPSINLATNHTVRSANILLTDPYMDDAGLAEDNGLGQRHQGRQEEDKPILCPHCDKRFNETRGFIVHKVKEHGIVPPLALRVRSTTCSACGAAHGTRARLLDHLRRKLSCSLYIVHNEPPMTFDEYMTSVGSLNREDNLLARQLPRTGPIPNVNG
eukprot:6076970-Amphidinium_carterae.1